MKTIDFITGDVPLFKRIIYRFRHKEREVEELRKVWKMLDLVPEPPVVYPARSRLKLLYPAFALGLLGLFLGFYLGVKSKPYDNYFAITQEVIHYGE